MPTNPETINIDRGDSSRADDLRHTSSSFDEGNYATERAIMCCRNGGTVSVIGVYGGFIDKFPMGSVMNRSLTIRTGQAHVQRYMRPLLEMIENGDIDPSFVVTHRLRLEDAPRGYDMFKNKEDNCIKIVLKPNGDGVDGGTAKDDNYTVVH